MARRCATSLSDRNAEFLEIDRLHHPAPGHCRRGNNTAMDKITQIFSDKDISSFTFFVTFLFGHTDRPIWLPASFLPRDALCIVQSAVLRSHVVCLSVCLSVYPSVTLVICDHIGWKSWKLIARTISPAPLLFVAKKRST